MDISSRNPKSPSLDDVDLDLIAALQIAPRASATALSAALAIPVSTVHRRIQRLRDERIMRVICRYAWSLISEEHPFELWIRAETGASSRVARALLALPDVQFVMETTGDADVYAALFPLRGSDVHDLLARQVPNIPGVVACESRLMIESVRIAASWTVNRLPEGVVTKLQSQRIEAVTTDATTLAGLSEVDRLVIRLLGNDGRISAAEVARTLSISAATASRSINRLLRGGAVLPRVEVEPQTMGLPLLTTVALDVEPTHLPSVLQELAVHPNMRMVSMVTGPMPVSAHGAFASAQAFGEFLYRDLARMSGVRSMRTGVGLRVLRRYWIERDGPFISPESQDVLRFELVADAREQPDTGRSLTHNPEPRLQIHERV